MAHTMDFGEVKATLHEGGRINLDFGTGVPVAVGPMVQVKQQTILLLAAWVQSTITGEKIEAAKAEQAQGKKPRDLEDIKKFIDDLQKKLPGIVGQIRGIFPHPITKSLETALARPFQGIVEDVLSENPLLREKLKELVKNQLEDSIAQDEKWQEGEEGGEEQPS